MIRTFLTKDNQVATRNAFTGFYDDNNQPIHLGDKLKSIYNYEVIVCQDDDDHFYGKLVCKPSHSCVNIPYSIADGKGHSIVK